jgi:excisionase family DNA binding protein
VRKLLKRWPQLVYRRLENAMKVSRPKGSANEHGSPPGPRGDASVMDAPEVCAYLHIHRSTLYRLINRSEFPYFRMGYRYRFNREQIDAWREGQEHDQMKPKGR